MMIRLTLLAAVLLGSLSGCAGRTEDSESKALPSIPFREDGRLSFLRGDDSVVGIAIEIADSDSSRTRGLMQRAGLPDRSGMLFIFPQEQPQSFWMANTQMALDLLFVDDDLNIVSISRYARPLSTEPVVSMAPARYVVEVEAGFSDTWGLVEGDRITWSRGTP